MSKIHIKIQSVKPIPYRKIVTMDGEKKIDKSDNSILVSVKCASQMVDDVNWKFTNSEDKKVVDAFLKNAAAAKKRESAENEEDEDNEEEEDEEEEVEKEADEASTEMGDEETATLLKTIPKMKDKELRKVAGDVGIDIEKFPKTLQLKKEVIRILKGK